MTIKELEETLGMTRANIRFYEQEGLLSPARNPNGYRDYSREDVATLQKIKLLRELDVDLDTIRALQSGEQTLSQVLKDQLARLEADETALTGARTVCAQLRREWLSYESLDAGPWLERLDSAPVPDQGQPALPKKEKPLPREPFVHPWRRYFARSLDLGIYSLAIGAVLILGFHVPVQTLSGFVRLLLSWLANLPMLLLEPLMLSRWGTTPGKAVFGITVLDSEGQKMSLHQARERTAEVFSKGMGYGIPIYELWRNFKSWQSCRNWEWHEWEIFSYTGEPERMKVPGQGWRCAACVGADAALLGLLVLIAFQSLMPPCRGELDLAEFCRNVNFYNRQLSYGQDPFTPEGFRQEPEGTGIYVTPSSHDYYDEAWSPMEENGETVGFRYTLHARGRFLDSGLMARQLGVMAYAGSLPETNCVSFVRDGWDTLLYRQEWEFDRVYKGVRLTQTVEYRGMEGQENEDWGWVLSRDEETDIVLDLEFTIRRAEGPES